MGLCSSSFSLAINTYFKDDRNRAFGLGATITGLGPIFLPHLITFLLRVYDTRGCVLIIGALAMNIVVAALLLKPIQDFNNKSDEIIRNNVQESASLYKPTPSISV
jgi:MFS family permease